MGTLGSQRAAPREEGDGEAARHQRQAITEEAESSTATGAIVTRRECAKHVHDFMPVTEDVSEMLFGEPVPIHHEVIGYACMCGVWLDEYKGKAGYFLEQENGDRAYHYGEQHTFD